MDYLRPDSNADCLEELSVRELEAWRSVLRPESEHRGPRKAKLGRCRSTGSLQRESVQDSDKASGASLEKTERRKPLLCPWLQKRGICRLPSCPYVHEVGKARCTADGPAAKSMPWEMVRPMDKTNCNDIPCRFWALLGKCVHGDACKYWHAGSEKVPPATVASSNSANVASLTSSMPLPLPSHLVSSASVGMCSLGSPVRKPGNGIVHSVLGCGSARRDRPVSAGSAGSGRGRAFRRHSEVSGPCGFESLPKSPVLKGWGDVPTWRGGGGGGGGGGSRMMLLTA